MATNLTAAGQPPASTFDGAQSLLKLRSGILNGFGFVLLGVAWMRGWVHMAIESDSTGLTFLIVGVFLYALVECTRILWKTSDELNSVRGPLIRGTAAWDYVTMNKGRDGHARTLAASSLRLKLASRISMTRHLANSLVFMGLIGTVLGFIIALSGVDPSTAGDVSMIGQMISTLIDGMEVALWTTFIGAILNVWIMLNYKLLEGGQVKLCTAVIERTEKERG